MTSKFPCSLWRESPEEHLPTSIAGVPSATLGTGSSTPRNKTLCYAIDLRRASLRLTPFWRGLKNFRTGRLPLSNRAVFVKNHLLEGLLSEGVLCGFDLIYLDSQAGGFQR